MIKNIILLIGMSVFALGSFMDSVGDLVESALADEDKSVLTEEKQSHSLKSVENEEKSLLTDMVDSVKSTIGIKDKTDNSIFSSGIMGDMADLISLEKGDVLGLPSVFGINKKKDSKVFGSTALGNTFLGDIKDTSSLFYRGFRNSGESTELMSGIMYKSSKVYNGMFKMFDDSPLNIFEEDEDDSIFNILDKGNDVLDIFD